MCQANLGVCGGRRFGNSPGTAEVKGTIKLFKQKAKRDYTSREKKAGHTVFKSGVDSVELTPDSKNKGCYVTFHCKLFNRNVEYHQLSMFVKNHARYDCLTMEKFDEWNKDCRQLGVEVEHKKGWEDQSFGNIGLKKETLNRAKH